MRGIFKSDSQRRACFANLFSRGSIKSNMTCFSSKKSEGDQVTVDGYGLGRIVDYNGDDIRIQWQNGKRTTHNKDSVKKVVESSRSDKNQGYHLVIDEADGGGSKRLYSPHERRMQKYRKNIEPTDFVTDEQLEALKQDGSVDDEDIKEYKNIRDNRFAHDIDDYRNEMKCPIPETITLYRGTTDRALERDIKSGVMRTDEGAFSFALSPGYAGGYANKAGIYGAGEIEVLGHDTLFDKSIKPRKGAGGVPVILEIEVPITALSKHQQNIALYNLDTRKEYVDSGGGPIYAGADYSDEFHLNNIPITYIKAVHEIGKERLFSHKED